MFILKVLFCIIVILLALVCCSALFSSLEKGKRLSARYTDVLTGVITFFMLIVLIKLFGGYVI